MLKRLRVMIVAVVLVCVTVVTIILFDKDEFEAHANVIGAEFPKNLQADREINDGMDGGSMLIAALENFYGAEYAASYQQSSVDTTFPIGQVLQAVTARRIRQNGYYWLDAYTTPKGGGNSLLVTLSPTSMDEIMYDGNTVQMRSASGSSVSINGGKFSAKRFNKKEIFKSLDDYLEHSKNDPTKAFMHIINAQSIVSTTQPILDAREEYYSFDVELDPVRSTELYKYVIIEQGKGNVRDSHFNSMKFSVQLWKNGFLKQILVEENYVMATLAGEAKVVQHSEFYFSFDKNEPTMQMDELLEYFEK